MEVQLLNILSDIRSELAIANILRAYQLKVQTTKDSREFRSQVHQEAIKVANEFLNSIQFDEEDEYENSTDE